MLNRFNPQSKILKHRKKLESFLKGERINPILVEISPTNKCNAKCPYCFYVGEHNNIEIGLNTLKGALEDMADMNIKAVNWTGGGEPTLYSKFLRTTAHTHSLGIKQGLFTNAYKTDKVNPKLFDWIRVSLTPKYFFKGLGDTILEWSDDTRVGVCMNITEDNVEGAKLMCQLSSRYGADYFQVRPALEPANKKQKDIDLESLLELKDYENSNFKVELTDYKWSEFKGERGYSSCYGSNFSPSLIYDGDVTTCNYHFHDKDFTLGNVYDKSFKEIWGSEKATKILEGLKGNKLSSCQPCCKNHEINQFLYFLKDVEVEDKDFL